jgi:hypothetical protein
MVAAEATRRGVRAAVARPLRTAGKVALAAAVTGAAGAALVIGSRRMR